jgi:membrane associated rhomboid family serine protease
VIEKWSTGGTPVPPEEDGGRMGLYDREYVRIGPKSRQGLGALSAWSANTWIIVINVAVFVVMAFSPTMMRALFEWGHFSTARAFMYLGVDPNTKRLAPVFGLEVWRFVTFQFLHANFMHLLFNMMGLFFFGGLVENYLGKKRYVAFYLACGICGALLYLILNFGGLLFGEAPGLLFHDPHVELVGASAGVFGILMACAFIAPNAIVYIYFLFPMRLRTVVYVFIAIAAFTVITSGPNAGGEAGHLGGAFAGAYLIRHTHLLRDFLDIFGTAKAGRGGRAARTARRGVVDEREVDRILTKVAQQGLRSLTEGEKRALRRATEARKR